MSNNDLQAARTNQKDEFYTDLNDINAELRYHRKQFKDAVVLCNCDDPFESNFFKYFALNFNKLGLKKLIATCYKGSPVVATQLSWMDGMEASKELNAKANKKAYKIVITEVPDTNDDGAVDIADVEYLIQHGDNVLTELEGDGDFASDECVKLLEECDICCTNPPFSKFREFVNLLEDKQKKYLIIGNVNAIAYKEFFPLIKEGKVWMGASIHSGDREFRVPDDYPLNASGCRVDENGNKYIRVKGVRWWTNLDYPKRHEEMDLYKKYSPEEYPKYDNFDAINVNVTADIPKDYFGIMGVPITFLDRHNPDQFEIIACTHINPDNKGDLLILHDAEYYKGYKRGKVVTNLDCTMPIMSTPNYGGTLCQRKNSPDLYQLYHRMFIKRKDTE